MAHAQGKGHISQGWRQERGSRRSSKPVWSCRTPSLQPVGMERSLTLEANGRCLRAGGTGLGGEIPGVLEEGDHRAWGGEQRLPHLGPAAGAAMASGCGDGERRSARWTD